MTRTIVGILIIVWLHWLADFYAQTDKMALNKSTDDKWLGAHCLVYGILLVPFGLVFAIINAIAHFIVDYITSRITSSLYAKGDRHNFFVVIGLDQAIHMTILIVSAIYLGTI